METNNTETIISQCSENNFNNTFKTFKVLKKYLIIRLFSQFVNLNFLVIFLEFTKLKLQEIYEDKVIFNPG